MENYLIVRTDFWVMALPDDWTQKESKDTSSLYFEAADGAKGLYINAWQLGGEDRRSAVQVAGAFKSNDLRHLFSMPGYAWQVVAEASEGDDKSWLMMTDCHARDKSYRAISKIIAAPPIVVRAAFHDYGCADYATSQRYFANSVSSLRLVESDEEE
ncbi:hypothetical protein [Noviherbaspirillum galbum]|uniref:Uncharacterized protein n=1 Tax=Noviherbaspirillum galbum TaxID=2709383 RepID=A0A6B3SUK3_9BURK|nr:hypothetical protein [Noviherbaspirillum galbum]NEX64397.1 hypothetical protein [Noviherbaspirillum galbum]